MPKQIISIRKPSVSSIYLLAYCIFNSFLYYFSSMFNNKIFPRSIVMDFYIISISQLFGGILELIVKIRTRRESLIKELKNQALLQINS